MDRLSRQARVLRVLHDAIGIGELASLGYLWYCAVTRRRDGWLRASTVALVGEGVALLAAKGCPMGIRLSGLSLYSLGFSALRYWPV